MPGDFALPVRTGVRVERLFQRGARYVVASGAGEFEAAQVVVAMAKYQQGRVPAFAASLSGQITQLHSQAYRNPAQLRPGAVLLVGRGQLRRRHRARGGARRSRDLAFRPRYR